jgi:hypothetical protein
MPELLIPVFLQTLADAPDSPVPVTGLAEISERAKQAADDARVATQNASAQAKKAHEAQIRIHAHNDDCANKWFWNRPANWVSRDRYRGYTKRRPDGIIAPHGEGESAHTNVIYRCANFDDGAISGLVVEQYASTGMLAGLRYERLSTGHQMRLDDPLTKTSLIGEWTGIASQISFKLGTIVYRDGSQYCGYCDVVQPHGNAAPSGFGIWSDSEELQTVFGFFEAGFLEDVALVVNSKPPKMAYAGRFSAGRLLQRAPAGLP